MIVTNLYRKLVNEKEIVDFLKSDFPLEEIFDLLFLDDDRRIIYKTLYSGIGNTPVHEVALPNDNTLFIKLESTNSCGGNHYSRYWLIHLALAESFRLIIPQVSKIIEVTSGSSGISLAMACKRLGYQLTLVIPDLLPAGRVMPMLESGARLIKVKGYIKNCIERLNIEKCNDKYYSPNHSEEKSDLICFVFARIASEFISMEKRCPDKILLGLGNGTSLVGIAHRFKLENPTAEVYSFCPDKDKKQIVFGLYADNLFFRHMLEVGNLVDKQLYIQNFNCEDIRNKFIDDDVILSLGHSSLYAIDLACNLAEISKRQIFFTVGYDKIERYYDNI